jgi:imidazoleglycerol-phosphate dehydratase
MARTTQISRKTKETDILVELNLDGSGKCDISTGIGFFDHMLTALAVHGRFDLMVKSIGDLDVDCHHTVEDTGIVIGKAIAKILGDKSGIERFGSFYVPMDEALALASVDVSGRPFLIFNAEFKDERIGNFDTAAIIEFWRAFAFNAGITLHINMIYGKNDHHKCEAIFKAVAHSLKIAVTSSQNKDTLSTKGIL